MFVLNIHHYTFNVCCYKQAYIQWNMLPCLYIKFTPVDALKVALKCLFVLLVAICAKLVWLDILLKEVEIVFCILNPLHLGT